jgi:4a-hydroxytetrahydrobiopterin dehydratase
MSHEKTELAKEECIPCQGGVPPLAISEAQKVLTKLHEGWSINAAGHLERVFLLKNFVESLALAVKLGGIAENAGHHPDLLVSYGKLRAEIWTHKIGGLTRSDFVLAAKFDEILKTE